MVPVKVKILVDLLKLLSQRTAKIPKEDLELDYRIDTQTRQSEKGRKEGTNQKRGSSATINCDHGVFGSAGSRH